MATDAVEAHAPAVVPYQVAGRIWTLQGADPGTVMENAVSALAAYVAGRDRILGEDIVPSQIEAALAVPGVYDVQLSEPAALMPLDRSQWAQLTSSTLVWGGVGGD